MPIKVFIFDSSDIVRAGLFSILDSADCIDVVGDPGDCQESLAQISELRPDVVVLGYDVADSVADSGNPEFIENLLLKNPATRLLIFASKDCVSSAQELLAAGADGYILKEVSGNEMVAAVKAVAAGRKIVSISELDRFFGKNNSRSDRVHSNQSNCHLDHNLSERECEVLSRIARGMTNQQVANELFLSVKTIETYRSRLTKKIGARNRAELFEFASSLGMLGES